MNNKVWEAYTRSKSEYAKTGYDLDYSSFVVGYKACRNYDTQKPESEPIAYISKIALEELQKPECSEDMFGVTGTPSGRWDVGLFLDPPPTVRVPEALTCEMVSAGVAALEKSYVHEDAWSDTVRSVFKAMRSAALHSGEGGRQ